MVDRGRALAGWALATLPGRVLRKFGEDQAGNWAVIIAWNLLFSLFPIALALAGGLGLLLGRLGVESPAVYASVLSIVPGSQSADTRAALDAMQHRAAIFFLLALVGLTWTGATLFGAMEQAFDAIYQAPARGFLRQKLMGVGMMLLFAALATFSVLSSTLLALAGRVPHPVAPAGLDGAVYLLQPVLAITADVLLFGAIFFVVPNRRQALGDVWPGALLSGLGFYLLTLLFPVYAAIQHSTFNQYGKAFAFVFILMSFLYLAGLVTMAGVELNSVRRPAALGQTAIPAAPPSGLSLDARRSRRRRVLYAILAAVIGVLAAARARARSKGEPAPRS